MIKIYELKMHGRKLKNKCTCDESIATAILHQMLVSKFLVVVEIMMKHCWGSFLLGHRVEVLCRHIAEFCFRYIAAVHLVCTTLDCVCLL